MGSLIIGFSGRARHGKTEACAAIIDHIEYENLGTGLKQTVKLYDIGAMILRYCIEQGYFHPSTRREDMDSKQLQMLVDMGKLKRDEDQDFWIGQMMSAIAEDNPTVALCPNLRYWNEGERLHKAGGYVVRYTRLNANGSIFISRDRDPNHVSETELESWPADFYITTKDGQAEFGKRQAVTLYRYLREIHYGAASR